MKVIKVRNQKLLSKPFLSFFLLLFIFQFFSLNSYSTDLFDLGLYVIPYPQQVTIGGEDFTLSNNFTIVLDENSSEVDKFTASELLNDLQKEWGITGSISNKVGDNSIILSHKNVTAGLKEQGYEIETLANKIIIKSADETGLFYGTQTLLQLIKKANRGLIVPGLKITDWPDIKKRAVHYDTKHHQDKKSYVKSFIKDISRYKINQLVWEWEDKLAYQSHPEIGAPGAFTIEEMQELTRYAKKYHVELVALVQGLGHVSYILKWPQHRHLREVAASNWEFCPLKEGTYDLLFDLWEEAIKATPGSEYIHIGSDETYELCACEECKAKSEEIGKNGVYRLFVEKATKHLQKLDRKVMFWKSPLKWDKNIPPIAGSVMVGGHNYTPSDKKIVSEFQKQGVEVYIYDPNPGIELPFLPYKFRIRKDSIVIGSVENSYQQLSSAATSGIFDGMINTSWDDSGLHNQMWMLSFATSAEYSWSGAKPALTDFENSFFKNYYSPQVADMQELYTLFNEGSYYYTWTLERNVWHYGTIGKTHLPDLPRNDNMEYNPFWNKEYKEKIHESNDMLQKMTRALQIIDKNKSLHPKHSYDFDLYRTIAELIKHTCLTYLDLSNLESTITQAHKLTFINNQEAYNQLIKAKEIIELSLKRREKVYTDLVETWERTRLPKGMSTTEKKYFHQQDRARHFANRTSDMSYLIYDEQLLDMEGYLTSLKDYIAYYRKIHLNK